MRRSSDGAREMEGEGNKSLMTDDGVSKRARWGERERGVFDDFTRS